MYDGPGILHMGRMERLRDEFPTLLVAAGQPVSGPLRAYLMEAPASNTSDHAAYTKYYSDSLRDLVAERDADLIARFGIPLRRLRNSEPVNFLAAGCAHGAWPRRPGARHRSSPSTLPR